MKCRGGLVVPSLVGSLNLFKGLPLCKRRQGFGILVLGIILRLLFQRGKKSLFYLLKTGRYHHTPLCRKSSAAAEKNNGGILIKMFFPHSTQQPHRYQCQDIALPGRK